jgi:predicted transcriptional regulator of viral defense system
MNFKELLDIVSDQPWFATNILAAGRRLSAVRPRLGRWVAEGKLIRLHKGVYTLAEPYRKEGPQPLALAGGLKRPSYVSLQSALAWHGLIPEFVPTVTAVTTARPQTIETPLCRFEYRHIDKSLFWGYADLELSKNQHAFIARPEKALLDLVYLTSGGDGRAFLVELRMQNLDRLDESVLRQFAQRSGRPKLQRAVKEIEAIIKEGEGSKL